MSRKIFIPWLSPLAMPILDILGYTAGIFIVISLIPQIIKSWKTKSTKDLSLPRYLIYIIGIILWFVYGLIIRNGPMIVMNAINLALAFSILSLKIKYG